MAATGTFASIHLPVKWRSVTALLTILALAGCEGEGLKLPSFAKKPAEAEASGPVRSVKLVERDVEAPDVFQVTDAALWDGRPSLGGVWVAYPGDIQPERVIIRNEVNGKFVIGALFKRERENPGPRIQLSSEAAAALTILAGQPTKLNVTALRREKVPDQPEPVKPAPKPAPNPVVADSDVTQKPLSPIAAAAAAIDKADAKAKAKASPTKPTPRATALATPSTPAKPTGSTLAKPFIQIGIFSIEGNATRTATNLRAQGIIPLVKAQEARGKKFWRVLAGPANTKSQRASLLKKVRLVGFTDAYFVSN